MTWALVLQITVLAVVGSLCFVYIYTTVKPSTPEQRAARDRRRQEREAKRARDRELEKWD